MQSTSECTSMQMHAIRGLDTASAMVKRPNLDHTIQGRKHLDFLVLLLLDGVKHLLLDDLALADLLCGLCSVLHVVRQKDVVEDGSALDLPQLKADELHGRQQVHLLVILKVWVVDQRVLQPREKRTQDSVQAENSIYFSKFEVGKLKPATFP